MSVEVAGNREALGKESLTLLENGKYLTRDGREGTVTFTVLQVSLFFTIYVFFQVWNQINCRALTPEASGFHRILRNPTFLAIAAAVAVGQVLIVTFGGSVFKVQSLDLLTWLYVVGFTATVLGFAEVARRIRLAMK